MVHGIFLGWLRNQGVSIKKSIRGWQHRWNNMVKLRTAAPTHCPDWRWNFCVHRSRIYKPWSPDPRILRCPDDIHWTSTLHFHVAPRLSWNDWRCRCAIEIAVGEVVLTKILLVPSGYWTYLTSRYGQSPFRRTQIINGRPLSRSKAEPMLSQLSTLRKQLAKSEDVTTLEL